MKRIFVSVAVCATLALAAAACSSSADGGMPSQGGGGEGQGGSMARFTIVGDCLYTVDHTTLKVVDITNPAHPGAMPFKDVELGFDIETIFVMMTCFYRVAERHAYLRYFASPLSE